MSSTTSELNVSSREAVGTSAVKRLRRAGQLPAVVYGRGQDAVNVSVDAHEFRVLLAHHGAGGLLTLKFTEGGKADIPVIVKEIQTDFRRNEVRTLDFLRVSLSEKVASSALLVLEGEPHGVRVDGGVLVQSVHEIHVSALPQNLPENIILDVSELEMNGMLHVKDIKLPEGVEVTTDGEELVASVVASRASIEAAAASEATEAAGENAGAAAEDKS